MLSTEQLRAKHWREINFASGQNIHIKIGASFKWGVPPSQCHQQSKISTVAEVALPTFPGSWPLKSTADVLWGAGGSDGFWIPLSLSWGLLALQKCLLKQTSLFQLILNAGKTLGHQLCLFHVQLFAQKIKGIPQGCWGSLGLSGTQDPPPVTPKPRVLPPSLQGNADLGSQAQKSDFSGVFPLLSFNLSTFF